MGGPCIWTEQFGSTLCCQKMAAQMAQHHVGRGGISGHQLCHRIFRSRWRRHWRIANVAAKSDHAIGHQHGRIGHAHGPCGAHRLGEFFRDRFKRQN